jgi:[acyl-carrier-protein] S-malonyltransferase
MGKAWFDASPAAAEIFSRADKVLGTSLGSTLSELCFAGPVERLNRTDASQPAIFVTSMACYAARLEGVGGLAMHDAGKQLVAAAGLSLGEYTALCVAGAFGFEEGLRLVALRGAAMQEAADKSGGGMLALIGATDEQAQQVADEARGGDVLVCANFNAPGQVVLSGSKSACERGGEVAGKMGLRSQLLAVAGAFHSPLMAPAAEKLAAALAKTTIANLRCKVVANVTARPYSGTNAEEVRKGLADQLTSSVRWAQSCAWMAQEFGASKEHFHELAPGKTLAGLMRRIDKTAKVTGHDAPGA